MFEFCKIFILINYNLQFGYWNCKDLCFECLFVCLSVCSSILLLCEFLFVYLIWLLFGLHSRIFFYLKFVLTPFLKFVLTLNLKFDLTFIIEICFDFYSKNLIWLHFRNLFCLEVCWSVSFLSSLSSTPSSSSSSSSKAFPKNLKSEMYLDSSKVNIWNNQQWKKLSFRNVEFHQT